MSLDVFLNIEVDTGGDEPFSAELFSGNLTHNLAVMADEVGIYGALWRPEENGINKAQDLIPVLKEGLEKLNDEKTKNRLVEKFTPPNHHGTLPTLKKFVEKYLRACEQHPLSTVTARR